MHWLHIYQNNIEIQFFNFQFYIGTLNTYLYFVP